MSAPMDIDAVGPVAPARSVTAESTNNFIIAPDGSQLFGLVQIVGGNAQPTIHMALGAGGPAPNNHQLSTIGGVLRMPIPPGAGAGQGHLALADMLGIVYTVLGPGNTQGNAVGFAVTKEGTSGVLVTRSGFNTPWYGGRQMSEHDENVLTQQLSAAIGQNLRTEMRA